MIRDVPEIPLLQVLFSVLVGLITFAILFLVSYRTVGYALSDLFLKIHARIEYSRIDVILTRRAIFQH